MKFNLEKFLGCREWIASDMFTIVADRIKRNGMLPSYITLILIIVIVSKPWYVYKSFIGLLVGFLSQKQQFGCITADESYSILSVYCSHDGAHIDASTSDFTLHTDWVCMQVQEFVHADPFASYMHLTGSYNRVYELIRLDQAPFQYTTRHLRALEGILNGYQNDIHIVDKLNVGNDGSDIVGRLPIGWCSWYHYYDHIDEKSLDQVRTYEWHLYIHMNIHTYMYQFLTSHFFISTQRISLL